MINALPGYSHSSYIFSIYIACENNGTFWKKSVKESKDLNLKLKEKSQERKIKIEESREKNQKRRIKKETFYIKKLHHLFFN